jgi:protein subunit release factor A
LKAEEMDQVECGKCKKEASVKTICQHKEITMRAKIEIRAAEGGEDSKLFVKDLAQAYSKFLNRVG